MAQAGEAGDNISSEQEVGNGTGRRGRRQCKIGGLAMSHVEDNENCKNLTILIGTRTGHRPIMQETLYVTDLRQVRHGTQAGDNALS